MPSNPQPSPQQTLSGGSSSKGKSKGKGSQGSKNYQPPAQAIFAPNKKKST